MPGTPDIHEAALAALARRALTAYELRARLARRGYAGPEIAAELERLADARLVDDEDLAYNFARRRAEEGRRGPLRVRAELIARGIAPGIADAAVASGFGGGEDVDEALGAAWRRLARGGGSDPGRLARRLVRDGFPRARVRALLEREGHEGVAHAVPDETDAADGADAARDAGDDDAVE